MYREELLRLNEFQQKAVLDESNACVVNANVGSGKTTVLIAKIIYLHYEKNIPYQDMIVLTFTNKAANEIKERLIKIDNKIAKEQLNYFGTFHSVALSLLKNELPIEESGYTKDFFVIEPDEELDIALQLIQDNNLKIKYKNRLKKRLEQVTANEAEQLLKYNDDISRLNKLLKQEKIKQNKMSFFDLIQVSTALLNKVTFEPKWIVIDEVQDSDEMQLSFIKSIKTHNTKLFAVGDPNQVIYSWRGSFSNVFNSLISGYDAKELTLPINYRSSMSILEVAKCFMNNDHDLIGIREHGNKIVVKKQYDSFNEAHYLAEKIKELTDVGIPFKEIAIFYRLQSQSKVFEDVFTLHHIPYEVSVKKTIKDIPVLNWFIKLLRFSINHSDFVSGLTVLSDKNYGEKLSQNKAKKVLKEKDVENSILLYKMLNFPLIVSKVNNAEEIYQYFEIDNYINPTSATFNEDKGSIITFLDIINDYLFETELSLPDGLSEFLNSSALYGVNILKKDISNNNAVKLMTLHASKGLEFSYVFITGVNYGLIPLRIKSSEEDQEEKRLFFVGITRAKEYLELSYYTNPDNCRVSPGESRYLRMIPANLIECDCQEKSTMDIQEMRKLIHNEKDTKQVAVKKQQLVKHNKYGTGKIIEEDDLSIKVEFEHYGVKDFIKAFSELEYI